MITTMIKKIGSQTWSVYLIRECQHTWIEKALAAEKDHSNITDGVFKSPPSVNDKRR